MIWRPLRAIRFGGDRLARYERTMAEVQAKVDELIREVEQTRQERTNGGK